jgi:hypothetical protein
MSCIAMADHIQLLDTPSTRSTHAASMRETGLDKSMSIRTLQWLALSTPMMVFLTRFQVPDSKAAIALGGEGSDGVPRVRLADSILRFGTTKAGPAAGKVQPAEMRS